MICSSSATSTVVTVKNSPATNPTAKHMEFFIVSCPGVVQRRLQDVLLESLDLIGVQGPVLDHHDPWPVPETL
jgi:hypothetical protein